MILAHGLPGEKSLRIEFLELSLNNFQYMILDYSKSNIYAGSHCKIKKRNAFVIGDSSFTERFSLKNKGRKIPGISPCHAS